MNHSCEPSAALVHMADEREARAVVIALRPMAAGEEVRNFNLVA